MRTFLRSLPLLLLALPGCGDESAATTPVEPARASFVGPLEGTDARVGLVREGARVLVYVCGGPSSLASTRWYQGDVRDDGTIQLATADTTLQAAPSGVAWAGAWTHASDPPRAFRLEPARERTIEDLYRGTLDGGSVGVVVFQSGPDAEPTIQGVFQALDGASFQVLPVRTAQLGPQGLAVQVTLAAGARELFVQAARAR